MATPEPATITDESSAVAHVTGLLEEPQGDPKEEQEETQVTQSDEGEEPEQEADASEAPEETEQTQDAPDDDGEELPDTLAAFAEALEMDPSELADHLRVPTKVNGEVRDVTLSEVIKGYQLESDVTQKTMKVAERERELNTQAQQMAESWQQGVERLQAVIQEAEGLLEDEPDMDLLETDPIEYQKAVLRRQKHQDTLDQAREEATRMQQQQAQQFMGQMQQKRGLEQQQLADKMKLDKPEKVTAFEQNLSQYLQTWGYTPDEITGWFNGVYDHRHIMMMDDARKYRALMKGKKELPKKLQGLPRVVKPGASVKKTAQDSQVASKDRLKRLRTKGTKVQQNRAAVDFVKGLL